MALFQSLRVYLISTCCCRRPDQLVRTPDIQTSAYSMKSLKMFRISLSSDCDFFHISGLIFCILSKVHLNSRTKTKNAFILLYRRKSQNHLFGITQQLYQLSLNSLKYCIKVTLISKKCFQKKILTKMLPFSTARYTILCIRRL